MTEQQEQERQLDRQQTFIAESLDAIQDIFFMVNEECDLIRWNVRVPEVSEYRDAEIREMKPSDFFVEEHRERIQDGIHEAFETGSSTVQAAGLTKAGDRIPFEFSGTKLQNPMSDGMVVCGIGRDISAQVERERELREQARRFQCVLDSVEAAIWVRDLDNRFTLANQNCRELFGIDQSLELEGRSPSQILPEDLAEQFRENDQRAIDQKKTNRDRGDG